MEPALTKEARRELAEILQKQFSGVSASFPNKLVEDLGLTLLNLTVIALKRRLRINKQNGGL